MARERSSRGTRQAPRYLLLPDEQGGIPGLNAFLASDAPVEADIGCGRGRFLLARAMRDPATLWLGVDRMRIRLEKCDRRLQEADIRNVRLIRADALEFLSWLPPGRLRAIYVLFPDPWPKRRHHDRRLVRPAFADAACRALEPNGLLHLATDDAPYFAWMRRLLEGDMRLEPAPAFQPQPGEETEFESLFLKQARPIHRASFQRRG